MRGKLRDFFGICAGGRCRLYMKERNLRTDVMNATSEVVNAVNREFKVWMTVTLGLIKDGKMGATPARAERIKTALAYAKKGS